MLRADVPPSAPRRRRRRRAVEERRGAPPCDVHGTADAATATSWLASHGCACRDAATDATSIYRSYTLLHRSVLSEIGLSTFIRHCRLLFLKALLWVIGRSSEKNSCRPTYDLTKSCNLLSFYKHRPAYFISIYVLLLLQNTCRVGVNWR